MRYLPVLVMIILLTPTALASNNGSELSLLVTYDGDVQSSADLVIENKMKDEIIELNDVDLSSPIDVSGVSPTDGDYIKITAILDSNDPTKVRTICIIFVGNMILHTIHMYSNQYQLGDMMVENTGNGIDWNTQNLIINFPSAVGPPTVVFASRNSIVTFTMIFDRNDNWLPVCDEGWTWESDYHFEIQDLNGNQFPAHGYLASMQNTNTRHDGGFCTDPVPAETEEEDPELSIIINGPGGLYPSTETFHTFAYINYDSYHYVAKTNENGTDIWEWDLQTNPLKANEPQCGSQTGGAGWCYHIIQINWT